MSKNQWFAAFIFLFLCLTWGSSFILIKKGLLAFTPLQIAGLRLVSAALTLLPFVLRKLKRVSRVEWRAILAVSVIGNGLPAFLFPLAETHINSASAGILNGLSPLFALLLGQLVFQFRFSQAQNLGVMIGFVGAVILVVSGGGEVDFFTHLQYSLAAVLATVGYGLSTILIKKYLNHTPPILSTGLAFCIMALPYGLYLLFFSDLGEIFAQNPYADQALLYVLLLGSGGTALAVYLYYRLIQMTDPIVASSVTYLIPLVALGWGLLDGESFTWGQALGMGIVLLGVYLANRRRKAKSVNLPEEAEASLEG